MKYYREEYYSVVDKRTGRKIADCGEEIDALEMVGFDPENRTVARNQFLMGQVVDVVPQKALPTSGIVVGKRELAEECKILEPGVGQAVVV